MRDCTAEVCELICQHCVEPNRFVSSLSALLGSVWYFGRFAFCLLLIVVAGTVIRVACSVTVVQARSLQRSMTLLMMCAMNMLGT